MKCVICKHGETHLGKTSVTLERDGMMVVVQAVPAQICDNCGEEYVDEEVTAQLLREAEQCARLGTKVNIREYVVA